MAGEEEKTGAVEEQVEEQAEEQVEESTEEASAEESTEEQTGEPEEPGEAEETDESEESEESEESDKEDQEVEVEYDTAALVARARKIDPEATEENYQTVLGKRLDTLEEYYVDAQTANEKLVEILQADDRVAGILRDVVSGADLRVAIARQFDPDELVPEDGDPDLEAWEKAAKERKDGIAERDKRIAELERNASASNQVITAFAEKMGIKEDQKIAFLKAADEDIQALYNGIVTERFLDRLYKGYHFEDEMKKAQETGEIKGRNAKIAKKKLETDKTGDGVPKVGATQASESTTPTDPLDRVLMREKQKQIL